METWKKKCNMKKAKILMYVLWTFQNTKWNLKIWNENLTRLNGIYLARNYILELISALHIWTLISSLCYFLQNCSISMGTIPLHASRSRQAFTGGRHTKIEKEITTTRKSLEPPIIKKHHVIVLGLNWLISGTDPWTT